LTDAERALYGIDPVLFARQKLGFHPDEKQARVLDPSIRYGILNCSRQWGKSTITAAMSVHRAACRNGALVLVVTPSERQSAEFVRKASGFLRRLGIRRRGDGDNDISLLLPNESRIVGLPGKEATTRGFSSVSLLLVDEASRVSDDMYKAMRPVLAVGGGDIWLMSTPYGKRGFFYDTWVNGGPEWVRVSVPATECPRIRPEYLEQERRVQGDLWFRQEYLCEFVQSETSVFRDEDLQACLDESEWELRR
jgi:hypothetical protein